jgi:hypothetical protein
VSPRSPSTPCLWSAFTTLPSVSTPDTR